jgi:hypothetical protein
MPICVKTNGTNGTVVEEWFESENFRSFVDEYLAARYYEYEIKTRKKRKEVYRVFYDDDGITEVTFEQTWA